MKIKVLITILITNLLFACQPSKEQGNANQPHPLLMGETIKINELPYLLNKLQNGQTEFDFIGIHSYGIDCIYFMNENGKFDIDYEAMGEDQLPFIKKLEEFAHANNLKTTMTTYNNKPHFKSDRPAPIIKIKAALGLNEIANLGSRIQQEVFNNTKETIYEVVP